MRPGDHRLCSDSASSHKIWGGAYRANAYVMRLLVAMIVVVAKSMHPSGNLAGQSWTGCEWDNSHEKTDRTSMTLRGIVQNLQKRPDRTGKDLRDITSNKQQHDEEDKTSECSDQDTSNHNLGAFHSRFGDFCDRQRGLLEMLKAAYLQSYAQRHPVLVSFAM